MKNRTPINIPNCRLRFAGREDLPVILSFIRELAKYEKLLHEVEADEAVLEQNLFGEKPYAEVVLAEYEDKQVGFALFFHNFSTFLGRPGIYLEDLYVQPDYRGRGIGGELLAFLAHLAVTRGCGRLEWSVLDWNTPAINFYNKLGAQAMDEWTTFRLDGKSLVSVARKFENERS